MSTQPPAVPPVAQDTASVRQFFDEHWKAYQKVVDHDYLGHQALYGAAHDLLAGRFSRPFSLLDLGCGDARYTRLAVGGTQLARYHGVDLSEVAIAQARVNLQELSGAKTFSLGNAFQHVGHGHEPFDVVLAGYSMHHLSAAEKEAFLGEAQCALMPGGVLLMIDLVRADDVTMQEGVEEFIAHARRQWIALSDKEMTLTVEHIAQADFPESAAWFTDAGRRAGFSKVETVRVDARGYTRLMAFSIQTAL